jgi:hypothetical protein
MKRSRELYQAYLIEHVLNPFYAKRLNDLKSMRLEKVLKRKNPYLFKAKNIEIAGDLVKSIVDAFLSSQEETMFGNLLENFAIYVSQITDGGFKSKFKSVDLEFERQGIYYIVGIKSGTNWGNADQINAMKNNFKLAKQVLREQGIVGEIVAVNGCMYGTEANPLRNKRQIKRGVFEPEEPDKVYYKYAGQDFWQFISGDDNLYQEIIIPIDQEAKQKDEAFKTAYSSKVNEMTQEFTQHFMAPNNQIDWVKLIDFVSKRR